MELWGPWWNRQHIFFQGVVLQLPIASKCGLIVLFAKAKGVYKTQEREGVAFGDLCRGLSVWESSMVSQSPSSRGTGDWRKQSSRSPVTGHSTWKPGRWQALKLNKGQLSDLESLQTSKRYSPSTTIFQDPEDLCLNTSHCDSATDVSGRTVPLACSFKTVPPRSCWLQISLPPGPQDLASRLCSLPENYLSKTGVLSCQEQGMLTRLPDPRSL